jgi:hypothetical protein
MRALPDTAPSRNRNTQRRNQAADPDNGMQGGRRLTAHDVEEQGAGQDSRGALLRRGA